MLISLWGHFLAGVGVSGSLACSCHSGEFKKGSGARREKLDVLRNSNQEGVEWFLSCLP